MTDSQKLEPRARPRLRNPKSRLDPSSLVIALSLVYFVLPLYWLAVSSTKDNGQLFGTFGLLPSWPWHMLDNISAAFAYQGGALATWLGNSLLYSSSVALGSTMLCAMAGYAFAKHDFPLKRFWYLAILGGVLIPFSALVLPVFLLVNRFGLNDTHFGFILPALVNPFGVYLMAIFWSQGLPNELIDAAYLDGANEWQVFWRVGLPLVRNGLVTVGLFAFVDTWNNFFLPLVVLSKTELFPATVGLAVWNSTAALGEKVSYTTIITATAISFLPLLIVFVLLQRYWREGLTLGALK